jgi:hypothetical protein
LPPAWQDLLQEAAAAGPRDDPLHQKYGTSPPSPPPLADVQYSIKGSKNIECAPQHCIALKRPAELDHYGFWCRSSFKFATLHDRFSSIIVVEASILDQIHVDSAPVRFPNGEMDREQGSQDFSQRWQWMAALVGICALKCALFPAVVEPLQLRPLLHQEEEMRVGRSPRQDWKEPGCWQWHSILAIHEFSPGWWIHTGSRK